MILDIRNHLSKNKAQVKELRVAGKLERDFPQMAGKIQHEALAQQLERTHDVLSGGLEALALKFERLKGLQEFMKNSKRGMPVPAQRHGMVAPKVKRRRR
jgi:hypothetical protein